MKAVNLDIMPLRQIQKLDARWLAVTDRPGGGDTGAETRLANLLVYCRFAT